MFAHRCWCEDAGRIPAEDIRLDFQEVVPAPSPLPLATQRSRPEPVPHCLRWGTRDSVLRGSQRLGAALVAAEQKPEAPLEGFSFHTNTLSDLWGTLGNKECHVIRDGKAFVGKALGAFLGLLGNHMALSHKSSHQNMFDLLPKKCSKIIRVLLGLSMVLDLCSVLFSNACLRDSSAAWWTQAHREPICLSTQLQLSGPDSAPNGLGGLWEALTCSIYWGPQIFFQWRIYSALAQILRRSCFTQGNPVPGVQCPECNSKVEPNRIPFQNGCLFCKDMGLNMCACICSLCFLAWVPGLKLISYLFVSWLDSLINY